MLHAIFEARPTNQSCRAAPSARSFKLLEIAGRRPTSRPVEYVFDMTRTLRANGLDFHVRDEGARHAVVLLHGFPDTGELWRNQIPALASAGFRVIVPDLRGRGRSECPPEVESYRLTESVQDVTGIMDALGVKRAHVVGHDWGAGVAWLLAALAPDRVDHLVALSVGYPGAAGRPDLEALQKSWYRLLFLHEGKAETVLQQNDWELFRVIFDGAADIDSYIEAMAEPGALTAGLNWYRANLPIERILGMPRSLPPVAAPALGVWSTGDHYLTERQMVRSQDRVTSSWRYERFDCTHWIPVDRPRELNLLLIDFLPSG